MKFECLSRDNGASSDKNLLNQFPSCFIVDKVCKKNVLSLLKGVTMELIISILLFVAGLLMIIKGSDWFIDSVIWISQVFKIPYIIIGATIVSICTTLPETFVSVTAAIRGETDYAFGNALGSIAVNTGFILAILLIFAKPIIENKKDFVQNGLLLVGLLAFTLVIGATAGSINRLTGLILAAILGLYLLNNAYSAKKEMKQTLPYELEDEEDMAGEIPMYEGVALDLKENEIDISKKTAAKYVILFIVGITLVILGSNFLVTNGIKIAEFLGVPSLLIAVTFTSLGTSLPELVTVITSIRKKVTNLGVGNIIGANILNIIQVTAISSIVTPIPLSHDPAIVHAQIPITLVIVTAAVLFGIFSKSGFKRWHGGVLIVIYSAFLAVSIF